MRRSTGLRRATLMMVAVCLPALGGSASAQGGPGHLEVRARGVAMVYENFFRVAENAEEQTIVAWATEGRITVRPMGSYGLQLYGEAGYTQYETLGDSRGVGAGLVLGTRPFALYVDADYVEGRPAFNVGDVVRSADLRRVWGRLACTPVPNWQVGLEGEVLEFSFDSVPQNDSRLYGWGGNIRYRGIGASLEPELGGWISWRRAEDPEDDDMRGDVYARLVSTPIDPVWLSARYRYRTRRYTAVDPTSRNFERWDAGGQWSFAATVHASSHLDFTLYYDVVDMESSVDNRIFTAQSLTVGTTLRF